MDYRTMDDECQLSAPTLAPCFSVLHSKIITFTHTGFGVLVRRCFCRLRLSSLLLRRIADLAQVLPTTKMEVHPKTAEGYQEVAALQRARNSAAALVEQELRVVQIAPRDARPLL